MTATPSRRWTIFTNHGAVLFYLLEHPDATIRNISDSLGLAERTVVGVLRDLRSEKYLKVQKLGRHNVHRVNPLGHMKRPEHSGETLQQFLAKILSQVEKLSQCEEAGQSNAPG